MKINNPNHIKLPKKSRKAILGVIVDNIIKQYGNVNARKIAKIILETAPSSWKDLNGTYQTIN